MVGDPLGMVARTHRDHAAGALLCEDMESAAVGLIALRAGIPCMVVRGISNLCGERYHAGWDISGAARSAQETLYTLLPK